MSTVNVSLPHKLRIQANELVEKGFYASFSDLVRDSLRQAIAKNKYDVWADEARVDLKKGKATVLRSKKQVKDYFDAI